jgi:hypothetical protein
MSEPPHFATVRNHLDSLEAELVESTLTVAPWEHPAVLEDPAQPMQAPEPPD